MKKEINKKGKNNLTEDYEQKDLAYAFWEKYEAADFFEREKILKPIVKNFSSLLKIKDEKLCSHALLTNLRSYFDDLMDYFSNKKQIKFKDK